MRKQLICLFCSILIIMIMCACGKNEEKKEIEENTGNVDVLVEDESDVSMYETEYIYSDDTMINFKDNYLKEQAAKQVLSLTYGEVKNIVELNIDMDQVTYPEELAYFDNLEALSVKSNKTCELSWLEYCPNIKKLSLSYNYYEGILPLKGNQSIEELCIRGYGLQHLNELEGMSNLKALIVETDELSDISMIGNLLNLSYIKINSDVMVSLDVDFSNLKKLFYVFFGSYALEDITALSSIDWNDQTMWSIEEWPEQVDILDVEHYRRRDNGDFDGLHYVKYYREQQYDAEPISNELVFPEVTIWSNAVLSNESLDVVAEKNYEFMKALDVYIDKDYSVIRAEGIDRDNDSLYIETRYSELVDQYGHPMKETAPTVDGLTNAPATWEDATISYDGHLIGLHYTLEEILNETGFSLGDYDLNYRIGAGQQESFEIFDHDGLVAFEVTMMNLSDTEACPISDCEMKSIWINDAYIRPIYFPQGNEKNAIMKSDYFKLNSLGDYSGNYKCTTFSSMYEDYTIEYLTKDNCRIRLDIQCYEDDDADKYYVMNNYYGYMTWKYSRDYYMESELYVKPGYVTSISIGQNYD